MPQARVHRIATAGPDDVSGLTALIDRGELDPAGLRAILGKTEGNGCVNDFTRPFAVSALTAAIARHGDAQTAGRIAYVMSGGTEGALSPHLLTLERMDGDGGTAPALATGAAVTPDLAAEDLGTQRQIDQVADGVRDAMAEAGLTDPADVHFVQVKCPLLTAERMREADRRGAATATRDTLKSMGLSRGAAALGVALALDEIPADRLERAAIGADPGLWSGRASTSAGVELRGHEIVVLGMSAAWSGDLAIDHAVMADAIDTDPVRAALARLGLSAEGQLRPEDRDRLVAVIAKADPGTQGALRGLRHTMLDDSDIPATRHARAMVGGALAGLVGRTDLFVSGGAEHQGPDGGGPVALIVRRAGA